MYLDSLNKSECCGCEACVQICPKKCIRMVKDEFHFEYPQIDADQCIHCNLCKTVCPYSKEKLTVKNPEVISGYAKNGNDRDTGSSGGFQYVISRRFIENGGVVFGAALDYDKLRHIYVESVDQLMSISKSKYLQSSTRNTFIEVRNFLRQGRKVLFTGTPCQISALKSFLRKDDANLYTLDFYCHGVPSQDMFSRFWEWQEKKMNAKLISFDFRWKKKKILNYSNIYKIEYRKAGKEKEKQGAWFNHPYYVAFKQYRYFRKSCTQCEFNSSKRVSDLTLSDFWEGQKFYKKDRITDGISRIIINTEKGHELLNEDMLQEFFVVQRQDASLLEKNNGWGRLNKPSHDEKLLEEFWSSDLDSFITKHLQFPILRKLKIIVMYNTPLFMIHLKNRIGILLHGKRV